MTGIQSALLADLIIDGKKSEESGLYISEMTFSEGISQISKAVLTVCSKSLCLKLRAPKNQNGNQTEKGLYDYLDQKATICFLDEEKINRTFTGKITSVTHHGVSNTISGNFYKYEFIVEATVADMKLSHHTRQIKNTINNALTEILSTYYGNAAIDFIETSPDTNIYLFYQQNETDYDFFLRLLTQFGLSFFVSSQKNQLSDEYYEHVIISDGKTFELPIEARLPNSHTDRNLNILVNKSSKTKSENIRISSWQMSNSTTIDEICQTDSLKGKENEKRLWFLNSLATPHSETQTDEKTRDKVAKNYLNSIRSSSTNFIGTARLNIFQATDILNIFDFYSPCNLDSEEKEKAALLSEDTIRARILSLNLILTNVLPFEAASTVQSSSAEVKFRCAEISKEAPSTFTSLTAETTLSPIISPATTQSASIPNAPAIPVANNDIKILSNINGGTDDGLTIKKATVCYPPQTTEAELAVLPKRNAKAPINTDSNTGECFFYAKIDNSTTCNEVLFTMPLAGLGQGLYRYPRIGERILVLASKDSRYILHSYLPDNKTMPFFQYCEIPSDEDIKAILEKEGKLKDLTEDQKKEKIKEYKDAQKVIQTNQSVQQSTATVLRHSSDNFINKNSEADITNYLADESKEQFNARLKQISRSVEGKFELTDYQTKDIKYSEIGMYSGYKNGNDWTPEVLRIQTPGNQFNHTGLLNLNTANSFVFTTPNAKQKTSSFGSFSIIDVGSVTIDAKKSITLKVGGNKICITEDGISVVSQTTCTNGTPYDSKLSLNPIGASLTGLSVNIASTMSTNVSGGLGADMSLAKGAIDIKGHTVDLKTVDHQSLAFDEICYSADLIKYLAFFAVDQAELKDRLDTGYNEIVKDGYFNKKELSYHMGAKSDDANKAMAIVFASWDWIVTIAKTVYLFKSVFPPLRSKLPVYIAGVAVDIAFAIFDSAMAMISLFEGFDSLTPVDVQRKITITNLLKISTKTAFIYIKFNGLKSLTPGNISYQMMDANEIKAFSSSLKADFVKVAATAHNVPLNPIYPVNVQVPPLGTPPASAVTILNSQINEAAGAGSAAVFQALIEASGKVPAFALDSETGMVGLDSNALTKLKAEITTGLAELNVISTSAKAKVVAPQSEVNFSSVKTLIDVTGNLTISSGLGTKIESGPNSIEITPANMKLTSTMLDMKTATLQMKADAALKIQGAAAQLSTQLFSISGDVANISTKLTKVG